MPHFAGRSGRERSPLAAPYRPRLFPRLPVSPRGWALALALLLLLPLSGCAPRPTAQQAREALVEGDAQAQRGSYEAALRSYLRAASGDPEASVPIEEDNPKRVIAGEALLKAGDAGLKSKRLEEAVQSLERAVKLPKDVVARIGDRQVVVVEHAERLLPRATAALEAENSKSALFQFMDVLVALTGRHPAYSYWIAILVFTLVVKIVLTPLTTMQFRSTRKMMKIQPRLKELQDQYKDRPQEFQQRMMALYKEEGVNPFGCGMSMMVQIPIMIALYRVIQLYRTRFAQGEFFWISPTLGERFPGVIGSNLAQPDVPLLVLYSFSMYLSQKLTMVPTTDPQQAAQQRMMSWMMPVMFLFILASFPSAFCLYWLLFNVFTTLQQYHLMKQADAQEALQQAAPEPAPTSEIRPKPVPKTVARGRKGGPKRR